MLVFIHGGGWGSGDPNLFYPHCRYFASRGAVAVSVRYRLVTKTSGTGLAECVMDCKSAIRYLRSHAKELGIDPNRLAVLGDSAGGHLAAAVGHAAQARRPRRRRQRLLRAQRHGPVQPRAGPGQSAVEPRIPAPKPLPATAPATGPVGELRQSLSPLHNVRPHLPPTLLMHGTADSVVKIAEAEQFDKAMSKPAIPSSLLSLSKA